MQVLDEVYTALATGVGNNYHRLLCDFKAIIIATRKVHNIDTGTSNNAHV